MKKILLPILTLAFTSVNAFAQTGSQDMKSFFKPESKVQKQVVQKPVQEIFQITDIDHKSQNELDTVFNVAGNITDNASFLCPFQKKNLGLNQVKHEPVSCGNDYKVRVYIKTSYYVNTVNPKGIDLIAEITHNNKDFITIPYALVTYTKGNYPQFSANGL